MRLELNFIGQAFNYRNYPQSRNLPFGPHEWEKLDVTYALESDIERGIFEVSGDCQSPWLRLRVREM